MFEDNFVVAYYLLIHFVTQSFGKSLGLPFTINLFRQNILFSEMLCSLYVIV